MVPTQCSSSSLNSGPLCCFIFRTLKQHSAKYVLHRWAANSQVHTGCYIWGSVGWGINPCIGIRRGMESATLNQLGIVLTLCQSPRDLPVDLGLPSACSQHTAVHTIYNTIFLRTIVYWEWMCHTPFLQGSFCGTRMFALGDCGRGSV